MKEREHETQGIVAQLNFKLRTDAKTKKNRSESWADRYAQLASVEQYE